jgi:hypothetical protein
MNGVKYPPESPKNCEFCGNPFLLHPNGSQYVAYRTESGKLSCSEFCADADADAEDEENWKARLEEGMKQACAQCGKTKFIAQPPLTAFQT